MREGLGLIFIHSCLLLPAEFPTSVGDPGIDPPSIVERVDIRSTGNAVSSRYHPLLHTESGFNGDLLALIRTVSWTSVIHHGICRKTYTGGCSSNNRFAENEEPR
jgi:hypothetical protein